MKFPPLNTNEIHQFVSRTLERMHGFEAAGWPEDQATQRALDYELSQLTGCTREEQQALRRAVWTEPKGNV